MSQFAASRIWRAFALAPHRSQTFKLSCAYAAKTRWNADQLAAVLEDIAANGRPSVGNCTPWEELCEAHLTCLAAQRPAVV